MSPFSTHVLVLNQQSKRLKGSSKWLTSPQSHITTLSVIIFIISALIKVPGWESGFLASDAVRAARNVNICLVPEFPYCFYGSGGLLRYIGDRIKYRGSCVIAYAEGACKSAVDIPLEFKTPQSFDTFFRQEILNYLDKDNLASDVVFLDTNNAVRSIPANSLDTKLCR